MDKKGEVISHSEIKCRQSIFPEVAELAERSAELVGKRMLSEKVRFNIAFCPYITDKEGNVLRDAAAYDPESDQIALATESSSWSKLKERGLSDYQISVLVTAHEAVHKCQVLLGRPTTPSKKLSQWEYINEPGENEAWEESLHVLKRIFPKIFGSITCNGVAWNIPEKSKYSQ